MSIEHRLNVILARYETQNSNFQKVWDFYIKFYTTWLTVNMIGLGLVVGNIAADDRWPIVVAFVIQNLITAATGFMISKYSLDCSRQLEEIYSLALREVESEEREFSCISASPVPSKLAIWGGSANGVACIFLSISWLAIFLY